MKTKEEFMASVKHYHTKILRYAYFLIGLCGLQILERQIFAHVHANDYFLGAFFLATMCAITATAFYFRRYERNAAKSCGLFCVECSRVVTARDMKLITTTHNCPNCGEPMFN